MVETSIRQFALLAGGKLRLAETPPLGGECEPIGRIVPVQNEYEKGDIVIVEDEREVCLEALFLQGAMGVVATRGCEPLPRGFCVEVKDTRLALQRIASNVRDQYEGQLIIRIVPDDANEDLCWKLMTLDNSRRAFEVRVGVSFASQLHWCDADEVIVDGALTTDQRDFAISYLPTDAPVRLAG